MKLKEQIKYMEDVNEYLVSIGSKPSPMLFGYQHQIETKFGKLFVGVRPDQKAIYCKFDQPLLAKKDQWNFSHHKDNFEYFKTNISGILL